jgi:hypothetical protein
MFVRLTTLMNLIQFNVIKFISDLQIVTCFHRALDVFPTNKTDHYYRTYTLLKVAFNIYKSNPNGILIYINQDLCSIIQYYTGTLSLEKITTFSPLTLDRHIKLAIAVQHICGKPVKDRNIVQ